MTHRRIAPGLGLALAFVALASCGSAHDVGDLDADDSPVARYDWDPADGGDSALMEGTLELIDGCLCIVGAGETDGLITVPVFSRSLTSWDADSRVLTYAGRDYALGDPVSAGGGWGPPTSAMTIPEACEPDAWGEVMHVQSPDLEPYGG
ncbi:hypothetical protein QQX13_05640 [Demequina sp. SYSU T00068]|uniref:hypothetical protein n=1 Tax=Demequina lignilytica TaxID=3051663 RepID=UPI00261B3CE1|nr:hypothetical protein [Demequina sp. SYSU T00068]MDN4490309.1 hypothetical protein [Demequina sp. SYSU T00068]